MCLACVSCHCTLSLSSPRTLVQGANGAVTHLLPNAHQIALEFKRLGSGLVQAVLLGFDAYKSYQRANK